MMVDAAAASESTPTGVRDDVVICRQMAANLSSAGYQVVTAHDGARALAQAEETPPDLAIVDLEMPGTNGLDVIRKLGHDDEVSHAEAFEDAAVKPMVAPTRVHQVLESVLEVSAASLGRGVTITIDCKTDLMARFDPALVGRVLHNLMGNAARYCNQGGSIEVGARRWNDDDSVEISVTNSGPPDAFGGSAGRRGLG